jgi:hypothetical protein
MARWWTRVTNEDALDSALEKESVLFTPAVDRVRLAFSIITSYNVSALLGGLLVLALALGGLYQNAVGQFPPYISGLFHLPLEAD